MFLRKKHEWIWCYVNKTEANLASAKALAARCVRVIHAQCVLQFALLSRTLLRSSSNNEPSDPPYRIVFFYSVFRFDSYSMTNNNDFVEWKNCQTKTIDSDCLVFEHNGATQSYRKRYDCAKLMYVDDWIQSKTVMIHTQVHLRIPCYDFYFL